MTDEINNTGGNLPATLPAIHALRDSPNHSDNLRYWDPRVQQTERDLIAKNLPSRVSLQNATKLPAPVQSAPAPRELVQIRQTLENNPDRYWSDTELQARHKELIEEGLGKRKVEAATDEIDIPDDATPLPGPAGLVPLSPHDASQVFEQSEAGRALLDEWGDYDLSTNVTRVQYAANDFLNALPAAERSVVMESFDRLPETVRCAVFAELARPKPPGADARDVIEQRENRAYEGLDDASAAMLANWIDGLDDRSRSAAARLLAK